MSDTSSRVVVVTPRRFGDDRGWFAETFNARRLAEMGIIRPFVQDNHSLSRLQHTIRGIHFQSPPNAQDKLVRCVRGRIVDIAVDLRAGSPTFGRWVGTELSAENGSQLYVPVGFGHAFLTLEPDCEVIYKVSDYYAPESEGGIRWDDPQLAIPWKLAPGEAPALSAKDMQLPPLSEFRSPFEYDGCPLTSLGEGHMGNL